MSNSDFNNNFKNKGYIGLALKTIRKCLGKISLKVVQLFEACVTNGSELNITPLYGMYGDFITKIV